MALNDCHGRVHNGVWYAVIMNIQLFLARKGGEWGYFQDSRELFFGISFYAAIVSLLYVNRDVCSVIFDEFPSFDSSTFHSIAIYVA